MQGELRVSGFLLAPCVRSAEEALWWNGHSSRAFFSPWTGLDNKRKMVREVKEKRTLSGGPFFEWCRPASFLRKFDTV